MKYKFFFFLSLILNYTLVLGQQELPPIQSFTPEDYNAENQVWSITQALNKEIYFANNSGVLEFNGAKWTLNLSPNGTNVRSVKVIKDKIYTGLQLNFGYWKKDNTGKLVYTSISDSYKEGLHEDESFWNIIEHKEWVLFQSLSNIYIYNTLTDEISVIKSDSKIEKLFKVEDHLYFQEIGKGLYTIDNGQKKLVYTNDLFVSQKIVNIFNFPNRLLVLTEKSGFYWIQGNSYTPWEIPANSKLIKESIFSAIQLKNGDFGLGTISNGFIYLFKNGQINYHINKQNGLNNNTVLNIFEDQSNNLWLALDNGINLINPNSPFKLYKNTSGTLGTVYTSSLHDDFLYVGTNQGLFFKKYDSNSPLKLVKGTEGQVWKLKVIDNVLFCGHNIGTLTINKGIPTLISNHQGAWDFQQVNPSTIIQGNYDGMYVLKKENEKWVLKNKLKGFNISSRFFDLIESNTIMVLNNTSGFYYLNVDNEFSTIKSIKKDSIIPLDTYSNIKTFANQVHLGAYTYKPQSKTFERDSLFVQFLGQNFNYNTLFYKDEKNNRLFFFTNEHLNYIEPSKLSSDLYFTKIPLNRDFRKVTLGFDNITLLEDQKYLIGTTDGYITINLTNFNKQKVEDLELFEVAISKVKGEKIPISISENPSIENLFNTIHFSYSSPHYNILSNVSYQYKLEGLTEDWSDWENSNQVSFENLNGGDYVFKVRAKINDQISTRPVSFSFSVKRVWYATNAMIFVYALSLFVLLFLVQNLTRRYYKTKQKKLLEKAQRENALIELKNKQELMKLRNQKLRFDIKTKNKELATSTMSIIRKNEFLNEIKKQLNELNNPNNSKVVKTIDKHLNNTDDWKMFQEAFNNADKDFIKKLKSLHPTLTPNDLRICAYLRLNLSSKEIAPLLNISPKSVEVKRYRLRKKMNLDHSKSLANYILSI